MIKRRIKKQDHERLDDATISRVVSLLESKSPITKKAACEILNIRYSTQRLDRIIQEYKDRIEFIKKRFAMNRGTVYSNLDIQELVTDYLCGESITNISNSLYRSIHSIKKKIKELNLPERTKNPGYWNPDIIPDEAISYNFDKGELVWAARYNAVAEIQKEEIMDNGDTIYLIWVFGKHNEFAYQPWWELGKLDVVKKYKLESQKFSKTEKPNFVYRID